VLLPIAPFTETPGTFVNAEGRVQGFHAVVKPLGDTRPAWKVLACACQPAGLCRSFDFESSQDVLKQDRLAPMPTLLSADKLGNSRARQASSCRQLTAQAPAVASIYQLDGLVRRATSLQLTTDARQAASLEVKLEGVGCMIDAIHAFGQGLTGGIWPATVWPVLWALIKIVCVLATADGTAWRISRLWERKAIGFTQIRLGPNACRAFWLAATDCRCAQAADQGNHHPHGG
jgi:hypothetical protein